MKVKNRKLFVANDTGFIFQASAWNGCKYHATKKRPNINLINEENISPLHTTNSGSDFDPIRPGLNQI